MPRREIRKRRNYLWQSRGLPKRMLIFHKSRQMQRNPWISPMITFNLAAIRIQALARRYIIRTLGVKWRRLLKKKRCKPKQLDKYLAYIDYYSNTTSGKPSWLDDGYSTWCAVRIQSWWRMAAVTRFYRYKGDICDIASIEIQTTFRSYRRYILEMDRLQRQVVSSTQKSMKTADSFARSIQYAWRRYCNVRVYRYFRDLVLHKLRGAPADLLRSIIASESDLLDKASGVHVRFRLGGRSFPPKIYYKIFTHRALCDVNAFAPRNYSLEKRVEPTSLHNRQLTTSGSGPLPSKNGKNGSIAAVRMQKTHIRVGGAYFESTITATEETRDWYQRKDNNPWRVISAEVDDLFTHQPYAYMDPDQEEGTTHDSSLVSQFKRKQKQKFFHYSRLKRQQDVVQARKKKKREWMLKAYMLTAGSNGIQGGESESGALSKSIRKGACDDGSDNSLSVVDRMQYATNIDMCDSFSTGNSEDELDRPRLGKDGNWEYLAEPKKRSSSGERSRRIAAKASRKSDDKGVHQPSRGRYEAPPINDDLDGGAEDALLKWSMALDYEEYSREWLLMATSMPSDADRELLYNSSVLMNSSSGSQSRSHK